MADRKRCAKRVFTGARGDMGGHMCGNLALPGSEFCRVHGPKAARPDLSRDAVGEPTRETSSTVTRCSSLRWKPSEGPVVPIPYRQDGAYGFITVAHAKQVDDGPPHVTVVGVIRKQNGAPGQVRWDSRYTAENLLPPAVLQDLLDGLTP